MSKPTKLSAADHDRIVGMFNRLVMTCTWHELDGLTSSGGRVVTRHNGVWLTTNNPPRPGPRRIGFCATQCMLATAAGDQRKNGTPQHVHAAKLMARNALHGWQHVEQRPS